MTDKTVQTEYRFNEEEHIHQLLVDGGWKNLYGVSSVVKDMVNYSVAAYYGSRRALMALGYDPKDKPNNLAVFQRKILNLLGSRKKTQKKLLREVYTAHAKYSKARAELGTDKHKVVDVWIKKCIAENGGMPIESEDPVIKKFRELTDKYNPKFVASEKHGFNKDLWIGGICDVIVDTNIGLGIWDNKNRTPIYDKDLIQMGGYTHLFPMDFTHVLGIPLEGKEAREYHSVETLKKVFSAQLEVYKFTNALKK